ncbi:hypothetical protein M9C82_02095 [SAR86 cluster bacterium]|nr:hypothetical protein M9C82_02095 [SAR86 cluster bacterium]
MNPKSIKYLLSVLSIFVLVSCGGSGDTNIASPGELGQLTAPSGNDNFAATTSTLLTGTCPTSPFIADAATLGGNTLCAITGPITSDLTLTTDVMYTLSGKVDVGNDMGGDGTKAGGVSATLTIPAGVTLAQKTTDDYLVVQRGSKIIANGTRSAPIRFTAASAIDGSLTNPETANSLWGGVVILGKAPINKCAAADIGSAACERVVEGSTTAIMGGNTPADNSGVLNFVRVEYAGKEIFKDNELNGITFGGVGSGTLVDYIQVHNNKDDCVEFFGGTVNVKHLVCTNAGDDNLDFDWGYQGKIQFVVIKQKVGAGDHIVESDNTNADASVGYLTEPRTQPMVANFTFIGGTDEPFKIREGVSGIYINGIVANQQAQKLIDGANSETVQDGALTDKIAFHSVFFDSALTGQTAAVNTNLDSTLLNYDDTVTVADFATSLNSRKTNLTVGTNTLVDTYFLGTAESAVPSAFSVGSKNAMCEIGTHDKANGAQPKSGLCSVGKNTADAGETADYTYTVNGFFNATDYIGAFSPGSDAENNWAAGWTIGLFTDPACPAGTLESEILLGRKVCDLKGVIKDDLTLVAGNYYKLDGKVEVGVDAGADPLNPAANADTAILTINPGVTIFGLSGNDYLVINRGSDINAVGTRSAPIVMTGKQEILGQVDVDRTRGLWGGLVILGQAPINKCTYTGTVKAVPCEKAVEGTVGNVMGGEVPGDSSGALKYLRVQYAGYEVFSGNELNGITFGGVGNGTSVQYVQVHNNVDDCVEFFGGTVDVKHLICTGAGDDNLDIDWGYQGRLQYVIVQQANDKGDHIVESDNVSTTAVGYLTEPRSNPIVSNFTFISRGHDEIFKLKEGVSGQYYNGVAAVLNAASGLTKGCIETTYAETIQDGASTPKFSMNSVAFDCPTSGSAGSSTMVTVDSETSGSVTVADVEAIVKAGTNNLYAASSGGGSYVNTLSGVVNGSAEAAATPTSTLPDNADGFFDTPTYIGAVKDSTDDWYKVWTLPGSIKLN